MSATCEVGGIGDLEDVVARGAGDTLLRQPHSAVVRKRSRRKDATSVAVSTAEGSVPGTHTVHVKTWGCSHNNSDGEYMAGQLAAYGYRVTDEMAEADLWVLNSCTVKNPSESHFVTTIRRAREQGKRVVVAGCVPQGDRGHKELEGLSVLGVQQIDRVVEVVEETLKGNSVQLYGHKRIDGRKAGGAPLSLPKVRKNRLVEIIPINTGCLNQCTYCKTVHARGKLGSYPPDEIIARVKSVVTEGVREIWITSEDLGTYGRDIGTSLPALLWKVVECLPAGTMMRLGMTNPPYILEHREEIARILQHPRVYAFLHIPVQSGSDRVLEAMRRQYTVYDFRQLVDHLRAHVPGISIATDVICGFPTESDSDFEGTMELVREYEFPILYISQFYPRPGTPAAAMRQAKTQIKKQRSREISAFFKSYEPYAERLGQRCWVLVTDRAADGVHLVAHNKAYEQVLLPEVEGLMGSYVEVEVVHVGKFYQKAQLVDPEWRSKQPPLPPIPQANAGVEVHNRRTKSALRADGGEWGHDSLPSSKATSTTLGGQSEDSFISDAPSSRLDATLDSELEVTTTHLLAVVGALMSIFVLIHLAERKRWIT